MKPSWRRRWAARRRRRPAGAAARLSARRVARRGQLRNQTARHAQQLARRVVPCARPASGALYSAPSAACHAEPKLCPVQAEGGAVRPPALPVGSCVRAPSARAQQPPPRRPPFPRSPSPTPQAACAQLGEDWQQRACARRASLRARARACGGLPARAPGRPPATRCTPRARLPPPRHARSAMRASTWPRCWRRGAWAGAWGAPARCARRVVAAALPRTRAAGRLGARAPQRPPPPRVPPPCAASSRPTTRT